MLWDGLPLRAERVPWQLALHQAIACRFDEMPACGLRMLGWGPACESCLAWGVPEHHHKSMLCLSWLAGMVGRVDARTLAEAHEP